MAGLSDGYRWWIGLCVVLVGFVITFFITYPHRGPDGDPTYACLFVVTQYALIWCVVIILISAVLKLYAALILK